MAAVRQILAQRLRLRARTLVVVGVILGIGFGASLASFAAARQTASAYERALKEAGAEDATISHQLPPDEADRVFGELEGIVATRTAVGFVGFFDGVDRALTGGILGPTGRSAFPFERPLLSAGRLPDPESPDEIFLSDFIARAAGLEVGQRLALTLFRQDFTTTVTTDVTIVGIGTFPREVVVDETEQFGVVVPSRAFTEAHLDLALYSQTAIDVAPGVDARRDLAPVLAAMGSEVQEARVQRTEAVNRALRPLLVALVALGALLFVATVVGAAQLIQRERNRWRTTDHTLIALGLERSQVLTAHLAPLVVVAPVAVACATVAMVVASPLAPVGPLHDFDPEQGVSLDLLVAGLGGLAVVVALTVLSAWYALSGGRGQRPARRSRSRLAIATSRPAATAGLTLGLSSTSGRRSARSVGSSTVAIALAAFVTALVVSALTLTTTPSRYGVDWDLFAVNQYGDQRPDARQQMFGDSTDVVGASSFTLSTLLIDGRAVPSIAVSSLKGDLWPTILRGDTARAPDEIVLGEETLAILGLDLGDFVDVQIITFTGEPAADSVQLRVVGTAPLPAVAQPGFDHARLGTGALVTRPALDAMGADPSNLPEWTAVRLADGVDADELIARNPEGVADSFGVPTVWFTSAMPAELRQLDSVMPLLTGAVAVSVLVVLAVVGHGLWTLVRASRRELAILRAIGFTRRQLSEVAAWQALPVAVAGILLGLPIGLVAGRWAFTRFARTLDVIDSASTPPLAVLGLTGGVLIAASVGFLVAQAVARAVRPSLLLRQQ